MNVLFISNNYKGCCYVRFSLPAWANGWELASTPQETLEKAKYADVVVFHRPESKEHYELAKMLKRDGKKIVMDNDDTFKMSFHPLAQFTPDAVEVEIEKRGKDIDRFMKIADLVTCSTETLAKEYRNHNKNVIVLANCIDPMDWEEPKRNKGKKVRIGLVGSTAFEYDYLHLRGVLRELDKRDDVQVLMFGLGDKEHRKNNPRVTEVFKEDYKFWDSLDLEHFPWCDIAEYPTKLNDMELDLMLIPRKDNYFNRCKSNLKVLESAMCEIPCIVQSFTDGPYEEFKHYRTAVKVKDNKHWMTAINYMIDNKEARRNIGKSAKKYVLENYNIENNAQLWEEAYAKLYEN